MQYRTFALLLLALTWTDAFAQAPAEFVDPFIGSSGGGNTFPGAVIPWGMVSVSPHNAPGSPSGYIHGQPHFYGLGHTHLSGTGCSDYGSILLAVTADLRAGRRPSSSDGATHDNVAEGRLPAGAARSTYRNEAASPGFYSVVLDTPAVLIEASATMRSGITRFTALESGTLTVLVNAGTSLGITGGGEVRVARTSVDSSSAVSSPGPRVKPGVTNGRHSGERRNPGNVSSDLPIETPDARALVTGHNVGGGMCGELNRHLTYFSAQFDREPAASGTWVDDAMSEDPFGSAVDQSVGAWLSFDVDSGESIEVRVGVSYVSTENAQMNLTAEQDDKSFGDVWREAKDAWNERLARISIQDGSRDERTKFYTALYHSLIHPNVMEDVNGEYPLMGRNGVGIVSGRHRYSVYSLWDTYRTLHPLLTLLYPDVQGDMVQTMVDMYGENGWLPKWELGANETYLMVGDPAAIVVADTYVKGVRGFDVEKAFEAIIKATTVNEDGEAPLIRPGYHDLVLNGYIPADQDTTEDWWVWGPVSTMLEYNLADAAAAIMADSLGNENAATELRKRSLYYRNYFDSQTGFLRPKNRDGTWLTPFDPLLREGSGSWSGSGGPGYVEGNAWNYTWFVPHDVEGLAELFGGSDEMLDKLDASFANGTFDATNEPDIGYPYTFAQVGSRVHRTHELVRSIMEQDFSTGPSGLPGNDDAGAISAWYVFSAVGFYPFFTGSPEYVLGKPAFDEIAVTLPQTGGSLRTLVIQRSGTGESVTLNGRPVGTMITHSRLMEGGRLVFGGD